jgi:hypothetical protein
MAETFELITTTTLGSNNTAISLTSIPSTYDDLRIILRLKSSNSNNWAFISVNGATGIYRNFVESSAGSVGNSSRTDGGNAALEPATDMNSYLWGYTDMYVTGYKTTNAYKAMYVNTTAENNNSTNYVNAWGSLTYNVTGSAITTMTWTAYTGNLVAGSKIYLYGIKNS